MHRGRFLAITKDNNNNIEVWKSIEFNGGMGLDNLGKDAFTMLKDVNKLFEFKKMILDFDEKHFQYNSDNMWYKADEKKNPYIDENGNEFHDYNETNNQLDLFYDSSYPSINSYYIKNLTNDNIEIICSNGVFILEPNQIMVANYDECINNTKISYGKSIDENLGLEKLNVGKYIQSKEETQIINNITKTLEEFGYIVTLLDENGVNTGFEIEKWTDDGVDMFHTIEFEDFRDIYDVDKINDQLYKIYTDFSIDDEIDLHREGYDYRRAFTISQSLKDFTSYEKGLESVSKFFLDKYTRISKENEIKTEKNEQDIVDDMFE